MPHALLDRTALQLLLCRTLLSRDVTPSSLSSLPLHCSSCCANDKHPDVRVGLCASAVCVSHKISANSKFYPRVSLPIFMLRAVVAKF